MGQNSSYRCLLQREQDRFSYHIKPKFRSTSSCICEYLWYALRLEDLEVTNLLAKASSTREDIYHQEHRSSDDFTERGVKYRLIAVYSAKERVQQIHNMTKNDETISFQIKPAQAMSSTCVKFSPSGCVGWMAVIEMFACLYIYMNMRKPVVSASLSHSHFASASYFLRCAVSFYSALLVTGFWGAVLFSFGL